MDYTGVAEGELVARGDLDAREFVALWLRNGVNMVDADDEPGDAVCWLHRLCPECGAMPTDEHPERCWRCGAVPTPPED